jgi:hypothetical protein
MRIESRDDGGAVLRAGQCNRTPDNRLMPAMKPVEIAERDYAAAQGLCDYVIPAHTLHEPRL